MTSEGLSNEATESQAASLWGRAGSRRLLIVAVVFLLHLLLRYSVIDDPPYWDSVQGPFVEANWLVDNDFDYMKLLVEEKDFKSGGPAVYVWSILPTIYAITAIVFGGPAGQFAFLHVLNFLLAGLIVMAIHEMLYQEVKVPSWLALLVGTLVVLLPVMGGQIDAINMEVPLSCTVVFTAWCLARGRWLAAGLLGLLGLFVKESGILMCIVSLVMGCACWYTSPMSTGKRVGYSLLYLLPFILQVLMQWAFVAVGHFVSTQVTLGLEEEAGWRHAIFIVWPNLPDLYTLMTLAVLLLPLVAWFAWKRRPEGLTPWPAVVDLLQRPAARLYLICFGITFGWLAMHALRGGILVRYVTWYLPLFVVLVYLTVRYLRLPVLVQGLFVCAYIAYAIVNQYGALLPPLEDRYARTGDLRERSREYLEDLQLMVDLTTWLDENAGDRPVLLQAPLDRAAADPRLGYVSRPMNVISLSYRGLESPDVPFFLDMTPAAYHRAYIGYFPSIYYHPEPSQYSPGGRTVMLQSFAGPPTPVFAYRVQPAPDATNTPPTLLGYYQTD